MGFAKVANVAKALEDSWLMLVGSPLHIAPVESAPAGLPAAHCFAIPVTTLDGVEHVVVLQISHALLTRLAAAMFGEDPAVLDEAQCLDAGKELANILSSCCIRHFAELSAGEVGLPACIPGDEMHRIEQSGTLAARFFADTDDDALSLSIIDPMQPM